jgi:hypothetical protein
MLVFVVHCSPEKLNENLPISFSSAKDMTSTIILFIFWFLFYFCGDAFCDFLVCMCVCVCVRAVFFLGGSVCLAFLFNNSTAWLQEFTTIMSLTATKT